MGWCSATVLFDAVLDGLLGKKSKKNIEDTIRLLIEEFENMDWDCQQESAYYDHPIVQSVFKELHPDWFEDD